MPPLPPSPLGLSPSFGFGDRIGLATRGHVLAMKRFGGGIRPIFAQQSMREMMRTGRSPKQVMADAMAGVETGGWVGQHGADADHLKTPADVDRTAEAGFVFFTIDPSEKVDGNADRYGEAELRQRFADIASEVDWVDRYQGKRIKLGNGTVIELGEREVLKAAVKYGRAIQLALEMSRHIDAVMHRLVEDYEIELSVDETPQPTTLAEHYIIAEQVLSHGMKLISLAPRFIGDFEKGVDYKGDIAAFQKSAADHAAIAAELGPYKLSLHSGSDKLSVYGILARASKGMFHVKTAGTSYLEALRVAARHDETLFREIVSFSRAHYEADKATYHVSAALDGASAPPPEQVDSTDALERLYLEKWADVPPGHGFTAPGRQILHCTFGSVLTDPRLSLRLRDLLVCHRADYDEILAEHFVRHLRALQAGM